jgi:hypothetical protein
MIKSVRNTLIILAAAILIAISAFTLTEVLKNTGTKAVEAARDGLSDIQTMNSNKPDTSQTSVASQKDTASPVRIAIPLKLADPEKTLVDYFKSIGYDAKLTKKDDNVERGNEKGLYLIFDLGNGTSFQATVFRLGGRENGVWEIIDSGFISPKGELLTALIEQKLDAIISTQKSDESEHNKSAFKSNTLLEIAGYGEPAYGYMTGQFADGKGKGERGVLMAEACIEILGYRNNVPEGWKSGEEWYSQLKPLEITALPPVSPPRGETLEELAAASALEHYKPYNINGVVLVAPYVFDKYEEEDLLTIWATVDRREYLLYGKKLVENGGSVVPAAIKLRKKPDGSYTLVEYTEAKDGAGFAPSIREFCKQKSGVAEEMIGQYGKHSELAEKIRENLLAYLKVNNLTDIYLEDHSGKQIPLDLPLH